MNKSTPTTVPDTQYCTHCDQLVGLDGFHVRQTQREPTRLIIEIESETTTGFCPECGVQATSHGRRIHQLIDIPCFGSPVLLRWIKRTWKCTQPECDKNVFTEQHPNLAAPRALLTTRAIWWAAQRLRKDNASIEGLRRQLGCSWTTVWNSLKPLLDILDQNTSRFENVETLGVDEHVWHHCPPWKRGPAQITGMVDLTRDADQITHARLLDLVPGRRGSVYSKWLGQRGKKFARNVKIATLDPFMGYKNAIDDNLADAASVLDAFHVVKLANKAVDEVRRRVQRVTLGRRGRKGDPLWGVRNVLRSGMERLTDRQCTRLDEAIRADPRHEEVFIAWQCAQSVRAAYRDKNLNAGLRRATGLVDTLHACPIPEIARLGKTLVKWRASFLGYFTTARSSNGGTEAINGVIELHRRIARGFRNFDNYRLRMLLAAGAFTHPLLD